MAITVWLKIDEERIVQALQESAETLERTGGEAFLDFSFVRRLDASALGAMEELASMHKGGVVDDSAAELTTAARKIDAGSSPTAVVTGWGTELDSVCNGLRGSYAEVWKIANEALAYPNAELVRKSLVKVLSPASVVLVSHEHFGIDLAPGLSVKMNAVFVPDVLAIDGVDAAQLKVVRQEFGGQVSAHGGRVCTARGSRADPEDHQRLRGDRQRQQQPSIGCRGREQGGRAGDGRVPESGL